MSGIDRFYNCPYGAKLLADGSWECFGLGFRGVSLKDGGLTEIEAVREALYHANCFVIRHSKAGIEEQIRVLQGYLAKMPAQDIISES